MDNQLAASAAQPDDVGFDALLDLAEGEGTEVPAAAAREPLLTTSSEFPANTGADRQQWRAAVHANNPSPNPFTLTLPDRAHRRSGSRAGSTIEGGSGQTATINSSSPSSVPAATLAMGSDLEVSFAEMMASLEKYGSGDVAASSSTAQVDVPEDYSSAEFPMGLLPFWENINLDEIPSPPPNLVESLSQANPVANMVGPSTQAPSINTPGFPPPVIPSFMGATQNTRLSVPGGYNMSFVPQGASVKMNNPFSSVPGATVPNLQLPSSSSTEPIAKRHQTGPPGIYGHTPNNSMGSETGRMTLRSSSLINIPDRSIVQLTRSATLNESASNTTNASPSAKANIIVGLPTRSRSSTPALVATGASAISDASVAQNPLHPSNFLRDTPRAPDTPLIVVSPNPLHPPSFHQPTPRAPWPTSHRPIPPSPAYSGSVPGYFQPGQDYSSQGNLGMNMNTNINMNTNMNINMNMNMNMNMSTNMHNMRFPAPSRMGQQHQNNTNAGGQQNRQMAQSHPLVQPNSYEYMMAQAAFDHHSNNSFNGPTPFAPLGIRMNHNLLSQHVDRLEQQQPLTLEASEDQRRLQVAQRIQASLRGYNLNAPMPFDGRPPPPLSGYLRMEPRIQKKSSNELESEQSPLAINLLKIGERFECDFCSGPPMPHGIGPYSHDFLPIWGLAGHDWCRECVRTGKDRIPIADPDDMDDDSYPPNKDKKGKGKGRGKRAAKEPVGPGPSPKKPSYSSSSSSPMSASVPSAYDRYHPMSDASNVFGDPQEKYSTIDNILINPFMHNLMCRGSQHRQVDMQKAKICERCKVLKLQVVAHGCHTEFSHIIALNDDGQWQTNLHSSNRQAPGSGQFNQPGNMRGGLNSNGLTIDVDADLANGYITLEDIKAIVAAGMNEGGMSSGGTSSSMNDGMNSGTSSNMGFTMSAAGSNGTNTGMTSAPSPSMSSKMDFTMSGGTSSRMQSASHLTRQSTPTNTDSFSTPRSNQPSSPQQSQTAAEAPNPHYHNVHMNRKPHGPISKFCMVCPSRAVFLCDGCPLTLCESCRYKLTNTCQGWFNNLIYTNGVNHNRNDAFLLRSDNGGYHEYGKFWPLPAHVSFSGRY